jgi:hypothetical protein
MYVSEPNFGMKLGKSSQKAKSCFFQQIKNKCGVLVLVG